MKLTHLGAPMKLTINSVYNDLKQQQAAFQRYITALNLPDTPEHFAWWTKNRAPDKTSWEWSADAPNQERDK